MNAVHLGLRSFTFLFVRGKALSVAAASSRRVSPLHRAVTPLRRAMATTSIDNMEMRQWKKSKQEPIRRTKIKENRNKRGDVHGPSTVYVQVVGTGSRDNAASLYVFSEYNRYMRCYLHYIGPHRLLSNKVQFPK